MKRLHTQAHLIHQEAPDQPEKQPWTIPKRCTVNTPKAGKASRCNWLKQHRRDRSMLSSSTASGRGDPEEGSRRRCGCHAAVPARFRVSPPDSGVVPFSEKPLPPIKSDSSFSGRVGLPLENIVMLSSSPVTAWGRSGILRDRAYGIS